MPIQIWIYCVNSTCIKVQILEEFKALHNSFLNFQNGHQFLFYFLLGVNFHLNLLLFVVFVMFLCRCFSKTILFYVLLQRKGNTRPMPLLGILCIKIRLEWIMMTMHFNSSINNLILPYINYLQVSSYLQWKSTTI